MHYIKGDLTKPVFIATWTGTQSELPAILLNSHMDVVPVYKDSWSHPPFAADIDADGRIFARGAQDMKCVGMQYFAAIRAIKKTHKQIMRTVHVVFVPDEEIGGDTTMEQFLKSHDFRDLNVGFALDEEINFKFNGPIGHGSLLLKNTVGQKFAYFMDKIMAYRSIEAQRLESDSDLHVGDVTSINLTILNGGVQSNVIPPQLEACFDMRIAINVDLKEFEQLLQKWCKEAGGDIEWEWICRIDTAPATKVDKTNLYWCAFQQVFTHMDLTLESHVFPGGTDSQFLRAIDVPSIGFSPMNNTPVLLHDHDEFLKADTYLRGIEIYQQILLALLNC